MAKSSSSRTSSKGLASKASKTLSNPRASKSSKSFAASVLSQAKSHKK